MNSCLIWFLFAAFFFLHLTDSQKYRCDYKYCQYAQAWFKYHVVPATWPDARLMCTLEGAILASPTSREIRATMTKSTRNIPIFTGLHATVSKGKYFTVDGTPLEEIRHGWTDVEDQPEYYKGGCLTMDFKGLFANADCYKPRPYICFRSGPIEINACGTTDPEYKYDSRTNKCYKFHTVPRNFSRANFACSAEGGHLAIINSELEAKVLRELFALYPGKTMVGNFWKDVAYIGFYDWGEHGEWRTIHGETLFEAGYDKFSAGEPNNSTGGEYCGGIYRSAQLNDLWCEKRHAFICEKSLDYPLLCDAEGNIAESDSIQEGRRFVSQAVSPRLYSPFHLTTRRNNNS